MAAIFYFLFFFNWKLHPFIYIVHSQYRATCYSVLFLDVCTHNALRRGPSSHCHNLHLSVTLVLAPSHSSRHTCPRLISAAVAHPLQSAPPSIHQPLSLSLSFPDYFLRCKTSWHSSARCLSLTPPLCLRPRESSQSSVPDRWFSMLHHLQRWMLKPFASTLLKFSFSCCESSVWQHTFKYKLN